MIAFRNRLDAWRAKSEAERLAYFLDRNPLGPSPDGRVRAGILCPCLNMGGAETWQLTLARSVDRHLIDWVGCVVIPDRDHVGPGFPHHPAILARMNELMPVSVDDAIEGAFVPVQHGLDLGAKIVTSGAQALSSAM